MFNRNGVKFKQGSPLSERDSTVILLEADGPGEDHLYGQQPAQPDLGNRSKTVAEQRSAKSSSTPTADD